MSESDSKEVGPDIARPGATLGVIGQKAAEAIVVGGFRIINHQRRAEHDARRSNNRSESCYEPERESNYSCELLESLAKRREKSEAMREKQEFALPSEKKQLIMGTIGRNRLEVSDLARFIKVLSHYDMWAIEKAEEDFFAYSNREKFQEAKRTGQYFAAIVRNKQMDIDMAKKNSVTEIDSNKRLELAQKAHEWGIEARVNGVNSFTLL